jgi:hypothetical protein
MLANTPRSPPAILSFFFFFHRICFYEQLTLIASEAFRSPRDVISKIFEERLWVIAGPTFSTFIFPSTYFTLILIELEADCFEVESVLHFATPSKLIAS